MRRTPLLVVLCGLSLILAGCFGVSRKPISNDTYSVSGVVVDRQSNAEMEGVVVVLSGASGSTYTTAADGAWQFTNVKGEQTITPTLGGYTFDPAQINVNKSHNGQSFTFEASKATGNGNGEGGNGDAGCIPAGSGTEAAPYIIKNVCQLQAMEDNLGAHYELGNDIDATETIGWNDGAGFKPVGTGYDDSVFTGNFDGNDYTIDGLYINRVSEPGNWNIGLFGYIDEGARIENVGLTNATISGGRSVGALVGTSSNTTIENSYSTGIVSGTALVGGLVGQSSEGVTITTSYSTATVSGTTVEIGGLVGHFDKSSIDDSYSSGAVSGVDYVGGLVGFLGNASVHDSYSSSAVNGEKAVGGLVGWNNGNATITHSHSIGPVEGETGVGGLAGWNANATITDSWAEGDVTGTGNRVGGLVGHHDNQAEITSSHSTGNVSGVKEVGGLVGYSYQASTMSSYSTGKVTGGEYVGGLVGHNEQSSIKTTYSTSDVSAIVLGGGLDGYHVGGLVGSNYYYASIEESYSTGQVSGKSNVGGLVGNNVSNAKITNSYSWSDVSGDERVGGLVGSNSQPSGEITNSYSIGPVNAPGSARDVGGLVGNGFSSDVTSSYWNITTSGKDPFGDSRDKGTGLDDGHMKLESSYAGWDFDGIWEIDHDYPDLKNNGR